MRGSAINYWGATTAETRRRLCAEGFQVKWFDDGSALRLIDEDTAYIWIVENGVPNPYPETVPYTG